MATAVLDLDLTNLPEKITQLDNYSRAFILIRFRQKPVGKITVPIYQGSLNIAEIRNQLLEAAGWPVWDQWLKDYLNWHETPHFTPPLATVAVCTRDRPEDIKRCLEALMNLPDDGQETIVIDNCPSTDITQKIVLENYPKVKYIREDRPGSSAARNRALKEAKHDIVAFTDDDATPDPNWLRSLVRNFDDPRVLCVTGQVMPLELENEAQEWFESYSPLGRGFKRLVFDGIEAHRYHVARIGVSANMALHKKLLETVGNFDEILGVGTPTRCGEDHDLFSRILAQGYKIVYDPTALSWHRHRRTWPEMSKTLYGYGTGVYAFWTRSLLVEGELGVLLLPMGWFLNQQLPNIIKSIFKAPNSTPLELLLAEVKGCLVGPWSYFVSRRQYKMKYQK
ncbi:glycosyltransferase [Gloeothece verrucosa]|uniref:Glycosyl transferase family 2 n=1 Tax=Gloeothece verrucosa (strain PCC 7822) TaxID=497965 RepID=E0UL14_GLOV7|nr:glycosyltransferase [Gloeothece verrucosa]ADN17644.1 glycosyl transferase family 2 [Gloeothece verrucosa PCC 7822]